MQINTRPFLKTCLISLPLVLGGCGVFWPAPQPDGKVESILQNDKSAQMIRLGDSTANSGDLVNAANFYQRAHQLAPDEVLPLIRLGNAMNELKNYHLAVEAFDKASRLVPEDIEIRLGYARALISLERLVQAEEQYSLATQIAPRDPRSYNGIGVLKDLAGLHQEAQNFYRNGLKQAPTYLPLQNNLALSLALSGKFDEAIALLAPVAEAPFATRKNRQNLALIYGLAGNEEEAMRLNRQDLDEEAVRHNLKAYRQLRALTPKDRAAKVVKPDEEALPPPAKPGLPSPTVSAPKI